MNSQTITDAPVWELLIRFAFNLLVTGCIIRFLYYRKRQRREYLFTFFMISTTIFLMVFLLASVNIKVGFALGLFAVFGILRYRTNTLPVREMTYLFVIIGISVINALSNSTITCLELVITNAIFVVVTWVLETNYFRKNGTGRLVQGNQSVSLLSSMPVIYERLDLVRPEYYDQMVDDLREKTGLNIHKLEIMKIDFQKKRAYIKIYFSEQGRP